MSVVRASRFPPLAFLAVAVCAACGEVDAPGHPRRSPPTSTTGTTSTSMTTTSTDTGPPTTSDTGTTTPWTPTGCYTVMSQGYATDIALVPVGGGQPQSVLPLTGNTYGDYGITDLVWFDGWWFACDQWDVWAINPATGVTTRPGVACSTIFELGGQLYVLPYLWSLEFERYDFAADVAAAAPALLVPTDWGSTRSGSEGTVAYGAWHSTNTVEALDFATGDTWQIPLEGYDTWVWGVEVEGGILRLLDDGRQDPAGDTRIVRFDVLTGQELQVEVVATNASTYGLNGLWCAAGAP